MVSQALSLPTAAAIGFLIIPGQEQNFLDMQSAFRDSFKPSPGIETFLFHDALLSWWNLHRCHVAELQLSLPLTHDPLLDDKNDNKYKRIRQFERVSRLAFHKAIQKLSDIQTEVRYRLQTFPPTEGIPAAEQLPHILSVLCQTGKVLAGALKTGKTARVTKASQPPATCDSHETDTSATPTIAIEQLKQMVNSHLFAAGQTASQPDLH